MFVRLHSQATTTPKIRADIQASDEPAWVLAERHGTTEQTVYKWRRRDSVEDRSHTPHRLQTTLTPAQEAVAVALRKTLLVSLDDLLAVVREFLNPHVSRSGLDRCLRRHGLGNLRDLQSKEARPKHSAFKAYEPGYIHIDVKYLPRWPMKDVTATSSWPSIGRHGGCSFAFSMQKPRLTHGAFYAIWSAPAQCASVQSSRIMEKSSQIASLACASGPPPASMNSTLVRSPWRRTSTNATEVAANQW